MMDSLKNKIVKLENNKEYFVLETLIDNNINYMLLLNLVDDKEIKIVKMILDNGEEYFVEITDDKELTSLKSRFKEILEGKHDDLPESAFLFAGTIEDVRKKAEQMEQNA